MLGHPNQAERTYHILGVPLRTGSLYPGNENDAQAYREVQLLARLQAVGCHALDEGDVAIPSYLPYKPFLLKSDRFLMFLNGTGLNKGGWHG